MTEVWITIGILAVVGALLKASGALLLGERDITDRGKAMIALLGPALLTALIVTQTFTGDDREIVVDERALGVGVAGAALLAKAGMLTALVLGAGMTAAVRGLL